jgi:HEAT repeat protein
MLTTLLILALQAGSAQSKEAQIKEKEEIKAALDQFKKDVHQSADSARIAAIDALAKHHCREAVAAIAPYLTGDTDTVRIGAAKAVGSIDDPASLEALSGALVPNEASQSVFDAVVKALQTLDWEAASETLNGILSKYHEKGMLDEVKVVITALGALGSSSSVDPLLLLLEHAENESKKGRGGRYRTAVNTKLVALEAPIKAALQAITGGNEPNYHQWKAWWSSNRDRLLASAVIVYRCKATGKRWEQKAGEPPVCPNHDKPEHDGQIVKTRIHSRA